MIFLSTRAPLRLPLTPERQKLINNIFITHAHIDHIKDICFLIENTFFPERSVLHLRSTKVILDHIHNHMLNDILWPDFSKIYVDKAKTKALLDFVPLEDVTTIAGFRITYASVNHVGPAIGFILDDGQGQIVFTGDTGPTDEIWNRANECKNLKAIFTEISFPNKNEGLARNSGHFTMNQLLEDLNKLKQLDVPIYIAHFKPRFFEELMDEFHRMAPRNMKLLHQEDEIHF